MTPIRFTLTVGRHTLTFAIESKPAERTTVTARTTPARQSRRRVVGFAAPQEDA